ncbi:MAG: hypothetical protein JWQ72_2752 [Polaromonas sp.]|nr:hypothetical protein [Polaromonas sp.]
MSFSPQATALVWFQPASYARLSAMCEDDGLAVHGSYQEWLYAAECRKQALESRGLRVLCIELCAVEFPRWCRSAGMKLDAEGRREYTAYIAGKLLHSMAAPRTLQ